MLGSAAAATSRSLRAFFFFLMMSEMTTIATMTAIPPITPPTMAPIGVEDLDEEVVWGVVLFEVAE